MPVGVELGAAGDMAEGVGALDADADRMIAFGRVRRRRNP